MVRAALIAVLACSLGWASESAPDWARILQPAPGRALLRQVVIEHRADDWLADHSAEVLAAIRGGALDSSIVIAASEVLLARAPLTYEDALDLHALLYRLHDRFDHALAHQVLDQWLAWLPVDADLAQVQQRMAERGWHYTVENLQSLTRMRREEWARLKARGQPLPTVREITLHPGTIYGQRLWPTAGLTVKSK